MSDKLGCGHPIQCLVYVDEMVSYCGWCADVEGMRIYIAWLEMELRNLAASFEKIDAATLRFRESVTAASAPVRLLTEDEVAAGIFVVTGEMKEEGVDE